MKINFYPGPSKVYPQVARFMQEAFEEGVLSLQHRSPQFVEISRKVQQGMREKLGVPNNYTVLYTSSSTEGWEIVNQAFADFEGLHLFSGAFGQKWFDYRKKMLPERTHSLPFSLEDLPPVPALEQPEKTVLHLTQNETSNGTQIPMSYLQSLRQRFPEALLAIDVASSLGGISLNWQQGDIWLASSQKCLGLPAGLGLLIVSEKAAQQARRTEHYNSLPFLLEKMQDLQTTYTPNVLGIYLLSRVLESVKPIDEVARQTSFRAAKWYAFLSEHGYPTLVQNTEVRSQTVIPVKGSPTFVRQCKAAAEEAGFVLGNGYGDWKATTFRIANFPALEEPEIEQLQRFLRHLQLT